MIAQRAFRKAFLVVACVGLTLVLQTGARDSGDGNPIKDFSRPERILVLDGSNVHDVGELHLHVGNWGMIGSMPGSGMPFHEAPSAEWPAGSGVEHLFSGGLWVGAIKNGIPEVSTAVFEMEFRPTPDSVDVIYRTAEGAPGGNRYPSPDADDDGDGMIDEDWLNGRDDDGDALIDEDFAAVSEQMFSCWHTDDQQSAIDIYPEHDPLNIMVRQESYQWTESGFRDFVGFEFTITNIGNDILEDIYVGFFLDPDVGRREQANYWEDDATGWWTSEMTCSEYGATPFDVAYAYDADGDGGGTTSYIGFMILGHPTDPTGEVAPAHVGMTTYANFYGNQPFEDGGDPTNDFERYEVLALENKDPDSSTPRDWRILVATGPFLELPPESTVTVQMALVAGDGLTGLVDNAAMAQLTFNGVWFDLDGDMTTGIAGRETPVVGPAEDVVIDSCRAETSDPIDIPAGSTVWINGDCASEILTKLLCGYSDADSMEYMTGVGGNEGQVNWILPTSGSVPVFVSVFDASSFGDVVELRWDVISDEEMMGFRVYRQTGANERLDIINTDRLIDPSVRSYTDETVRPGETYLYALGVVLEDGSEILSPLTEVKVASVSLRLDQNYPNPFNPGTTISFVVPEPAHVGLSIYAPDGRLVRTLLDDTVSEGFRKVAWDGTDNAGNPVSSGVYFYRLKTGKRTLARKMVHLR